MATHAGIADRSWSILGRQTRRRARTFVALADIPSPAVTSVHDLPRRPRTPSTRSARLPPRRRRKSARRDRQGASCDGLVLYGPALVRQQAAPLRGLDT